MGGVRADAMRGACGPTPCVGRAAPWIRRVVPWSGRPDAVGRAGPRLRAPPRTRAPVPAIFMQACLIVFGSAAMLLSTPRQHTAPHAAVPEGSARVRPDARHRRPARGERGTRRAGRPAEPRSVEAAHPGPRLDRRPPDRAPDLDRPLGPAGRHRRGRLPRPGREGPRRARHLRGRGRRGGRRPAARRAAGGLAAGAYRPGRGTARIRARSPLPLVRPAHVGRLDGHRPADGDLGPRPGRRRRARRAPPAHRPAEARGPHRRARPRLRVHRPRTHPARRGVPRRTHRPRRHPLGVRPRGRGPAGHRPRPRLLPPRHPARPPRRPRPDRRGRRRRPLARHRPGLRGPARPRPPAEGGAR